MPNLSNEPTKDDMPRTFPEWQKQYITLANWQYVAFGTIMLLIGLVSGVIIGLRLRG